MKKLLRDNFRLVLCLGTIIIVAFIFSLTKHAYSSETTTIYTRDELSELINAEHANDVTNVDIRSYVNSSVVSNIVEYLRYSIVGNICILDIGGVQFSTTGSQVHWLTVPEQIIPKSRAVVSIYNTNLTSSNLVITNIFSQKVNAHIFDTGSAMYGQVIWKI